MPVRADILSALKDFIANEGGMKFQHLAVAIGRMRWPELIAALEKCEFKGLLAEVKARKAIDRPSAP